MAKRDPMGREVPDDAGYGGYIYGIPDEDKVNDYRQSVGSTLGNFLKSMFIRTGDASQQQESTPWPMKFTPSPQQQMVPMRGAEAPMGEVPNPWGLASGQNPNMSSFTSPSSSSYPYSYRAGEEGPVREATPDGGTYEEPPKGEMPAEKEEGGGMSQWLSMAAGLGIALAKAQGDQRRWQGQEMTNIGRTLASPWTGLQPGPAQARPSQIGSMMDTMAHMLWMTQKYGQAADEQNESEQDKEKKTAYSPWRSSHK